MKNWSALLISTAKMCAKNVNIANDRMPGAAARAGCETASDSAGAAAISRSLQQMGLKLEPRKRPMEQLIVEHAERAPVAN